MLDPSAGNHVQPCLRLPSHFGDIPAPDVPPWISPSPEFSAVKPAGLILLDGLLEMCGIRNQAPTKPVDFEGYLSFTNSRVEQLRGLR